MGSAASKQEEKPVLPKASPVTPKAAVEASKLPKSAAEKAHEQEAQLKESIQKPAQRKIEVLTGLKPDEYTDFDKFAAAVKGVIAFLSGDKEGMEEVKNYFIKAGANKDELTGFMHDGDDQDDGITVPPLPPAKEEKVSNPDKPEMSKIERDEWNPEQLGLNRETAWKKRGEAQFALRETEKQNLTPYLEEAEREYHVPRSTILAIILKESSMNTKAGHKEDVIDRRTGKKVGERVNAKGFAQAISRTGNEFFEHLKNKGETIPPEGLYHPRIGVLLTAWYIRNNIDYVSKIAKKGTVTFSHCQYEDVVKEREWAKQNHKKMRKLKEKKYTIPVSSAALFDSNDVEAIYLCHNSGPNGYLAQCYLKEAQKRGDPEEIKYATEALFIFQQEIKKGRSDWQNRGDYAKQVAAVAWNITEINKTQHHVDDTAQMSS